MLMCVVMIAFVLVIRFARNQETRKRVSCSLRTDAEIIAHETGLGASRGIFGFHWDTNYWYAVARYEHDGVVYESRLIDSQRNNEKEANRDYPLDKKIVYIDPQKPENVLGQKADKKTPLAARIGEGMLIAVGLFFLYIELWGKYHG